MVFKKKCEVSCVFFCLFVLVQSELLLFKLGLLSGKTEARLNHLLSNKSVILSLPEKAMRIDLKEKSTQTAYSYHSGYMLTELGEN